MIPKNPGRLAIHRRSEEIAFLQCRLRALSEHHRHHQNGAIDERDLQLEILRREHELADEFLHTRQIEPLGETLQRRLVMAERICSELGHQAQPPYHGSPQTATQTEGGANLARDRQEHGQASDETAVSTALWIAEIERQALARTLNLWWVWLREPQAGQ